MKGISRIAGLCLLIGLPLLVGCAPKLGVRLMASGKYGPVAQFKTTHSTFMSDESFNRHVAFLHGGRIYLGTALAREFWLSQPMEVRLGDGIEIPLLIDEPPIYWKERNGGVSQEDCDCLFVIFISEFPDSEISYQRTDRFCMGDFIKK